MQPAQNPENRWGFRRNEKGRLVIPKWIWVLAGAALVLVILVLISRPRLFRSRLSLNQTARTPYSAGKYGGGGEPGLAPVTLTQPQESTQVSGPMIIRTASLVLVTREIDKARASIERLVHQYQGYIDEITVSSETYTARSLTATLRIPAHQLDNALAELKKLGRVSEETQKGKEVTAQYVDISARLSNARSTEKRLLDILRQYTGKVEDILAVEKEIARVREQIERTQAQLKHLENQVRFATINLRVSEEYQAPLHLPSTAVGTRLRNAAVEGYHGVVESVMGLVEFILGYGPSIVFWCLILFWPARWAWRRLRKRPAQS